MMTTRHPRNTMTLFLILAVALALSGCAGNAMYRTDYALCHYEKRGDCPTGALQEYDPSGDHAYRLGIVEYDDQGQLRNPDQMAAVLDDYRNIAGSTDILLVTFVHGWHHNAKPEDNNILSFRQLLGQISRIEKTASEQQSRARRQVLGVYIGWRGESIDIPLVNDLTFWERKNTAHKVGQVGIAELLLKLEEIVNVKAGQEEENPPPAYSRMVVIGHSFGGAVVFTSLQNILTDRFVNSRRGKTFQGDADGFGDLVVLLNPAFEAMRFSALYDLSQASCRRYFQTQLPKLAILTSETDYATKVAFKLGRTFSTLFETHDTLHRHYCSAPGKAGEQPMDVAEGEADRTAIGHYLPYQTHQLKPADKAGMRLKDYRIAQVQTAWSAQQYGASLDFEGSRLVSLGRTDPRNPYLNIRVDKHLMNGHNDIWGDAVVSFLRDLIVISTTPVNRRE